VPPERGGGERGERGTRGKKITGTRDTSNWKESSFDRKLAVTSNRNIEYGSQRMEQSRTMQVILRASVGLGQHARQGLHHSFCGLRNQGFSAEFISGPETKRGNCQIFTGDISIFDPRTRYSAPSDDVLQRGYRIESTDHCNNFAIAPLNAFAATLKSRNDRGGDPNGPKTGQKGERSFA